jgi:hypothetical protein
MNAQYNVRTGRDYCSVGRRDLKDKEEEEKIVGAFYV